MGQLRAGYKWEVISEGYGGGSTIQSITDVFRGMTRTAPVTKLPRGFTTWEIGGVRLMVLSRLAPRWPRHLIHRPA